MKAKESGSPKNRNTSKFLQILRSGDVRAFERFYVDNYALIRDYLTKWNIRYEEAEEIAQDVMITVWDMRDNFFGVDDKQLFKYIYITAKSMAMKLEKTKQKQLELTTFLRFNPNHTFESPEETFIINEQIESIFNLLVINTMPTDPLKIYEWVVIEYKKTFSFLYRLQGNSIDDSNIDPKMYQKMTYNTEFIMSYSKILFLKGHYTEALDPMERAARIAPSTGTLCNLGEIYQHLGRYEDAEKSFIRAGRMVPVHLYPLYRRFKLYQKMENSEKSLIMAKEILAKKVPIVSSVTLRIKSEASSYISGSLISDSAN